MSTQLPPWMMQDMIEMGLLQDESDDSMMAPTLRMGPPSPVLALTNVEADTAVWPNDIQETGIADSEMQAETEQQGPDSQAETEQHGPDSQTETEQHGPDFQTEQHDTDSQAEVESGPMTEQHEPGSKAETSIQAETGVQAESGSQTEQHEPDGQAEAANQEPLIIEQELEEIMRADSAAVGSADAGSKPVPAGKKKRVRLKKKTGPIDRWVRRIPSSIAVAPSEALLSPSKGFSPEVHQKLVDGMAELGIEIINYNVSMPKKNPAWGKLRLRGMEATVQPIKTPNMGSAVGLGFTLHPEPVPASRKRKLPACGLVTKPLKVNYFGTLRRYGASHAASSVLSIRGCRDFPNCIRFADKYTAHMESMRLPPGRFINPCFAEHVMGFPKNWTNIEQDVPNMPQETELWPDERFAGTSLFSGVGGIELGVAKAVRTTAYCDADKHCAALLRKRQSEGLLPPGQVHEDVRGLKTEDVQGSEFMTAGFPCPDISGAGGHAGFGGQRSSLFADLLLAAARSGCRFLLLENVGNILSHDMAEVLRLVLLWLLILGFTNIKWGTIKACNVGSPQSRKRWFLLATKPDADINRLRKLLPLDRKFVENLPKLPWNPKCKVPMELWLFGTNAYSLKSFLMASGQPGPST